MKIYLSIHQLPELKDVPKKDRKYVYQRHLKKADNQWQVGVFAALYIALYMLAFFTSNYLLHNDYSIWATLVISIPIYMIAAFFLHIGRLNWSRPYIQKEVEFWNSKGLI
jgi:cation transport ATPase